MIIKSYEVEKKISFFEKNNLLLLYGENNGLKKDIKNIVKKNLISISNDNNIEIQNFYENEIIENDENFLNSIYSGSLFSSQKIIVVNNGTDKIIAAIENILEKYPLNVFLIIYSDILDKKSKLRNLFEKNKKTICIPCYLDNDRDLENIAFNELKKNNISLSRESINVLIEKSNNDRSYLRNEIEKIKAYSLNKKKIEIEEIKSLINFTGDYKSNTLIDECLCGNIIQYKKALSEIYINTLNQIFLLRILSNKIQKLLSMKMKQKNFDNIDNLIDASSPPIFWKEKPIVKKQLNIWNTKQLRNIINEVNQTEVLCKKNPQSSRIIFFNFINGICQKANSFS
tara:strand:- start:2859 stop:3884 length:1026 start_codon:yes stop_codon:yes gene_type:complete